MNSNLASTLLLVATVAQLGCSDQVKDITTPPVPAHCSSNKDMNGLHFTFQKWNEGLAIMFVDHIEGSSTVRGLLEENVYTVRGSIKRADGLGYQWRLETADGRSGELNINDVPYDLTKGTLFAVQISGDNVIVHQNEQDLSKLDCDLASCTEFVNNSPDIIQLVTGEDKE